MQGPEGPDGRRRIGVTDEPFPLTVGPSERLGLGQPLQQPDRRASSASRPAPDAAAGGPRRPSAATGCAGATRRPSAVSITRATRRSAAFDVPAARGRPPPARPRSWSCSAAGPAPTRPAHPSVGSPSASTVARADTCDEVSPASDCWRRRRDSGDHHPQAGGQLASSESTEPSVRAGQRAAGSAVSGPAPLAVGRPRRAGRSSVSVWGLRLRGHDGRDLSGAIRRSRARGGSSGPGSSFTILIRFC